MNFGVKRFKSLIRKRGHRDDFKIFQVRLLQKIENTNRIRKSRVRADVESLLSRFDTVFGMTFPRDFYRKEMWSIQLKHQWKIDPHTDPSISYRQQGSWRQRCI